MSRRSVHTIGEAVSLNVKQAVEGQGLRETGRPGLFGKASDKKGPGGLFAAFFGLALQIRPNAAGPDAKGAKAGDVKPGLGQPANPAREGSLRHPLVSADAPLRAKPGQGESAVKAGGSLGAQDVLVAEKGSRRLVGARSARPADGMASAEEGSGGEGATAPRKAVQRKRDDSTEGASELLVAQLSGSSLALSKTDDKARRPGMKDEGVEVRGPDEERGRAKGKDDPTLASRIQLSDLRKNQARREASSAEVVTAASVDGSGKSAASEDSGRSREITLDLAKTSTLQSQDRGSEPRAVEGSNSGGNFASMLADRLRDSGNTEIVQSARIILKDGDSGSIRMRLNPPELGNVKIELNLADNCISGKIIVESDEAKSAFEKGLADLQDAFAAGGFESAKLEVSVGGGDAGQAGSGNRGEPGTEPFWSERSRNVALDRASPAPQPNASRAERAVDIVI